MQSQLTTITEPELRDTAIEVEAREQFIDLEGSQVSDVVRPSDDAAAEALRPEEPWIDPRYRNWGEYPMRWTGPNTFEGSDDSVGLKLSEVQAAHGIWTAIVDFNPIEESVNGTGRSRWHARQAAERNLRALTARFNVLAFRLTHSDSKQPRKAAPR